MQEFIINGENGILVKPKNTEELSSAMCAILQNDRFRNKLGLNARDIILKSWDWKVVIEKTLALIENMVE
jgi:glycosyltransferase involved in cell wall biosynthesis